MKTTLQDLVLQYASKTGYTM